MLTSIRLRRGTTTRLARGTKLLEFRHSCAPFLSVSTINTTYPTYPLILCQAKSANEYNYFHVWYAAHVMTGQMAVQQLRSTLDWTQSRLSTESWLSERHIRRIEKGLVRPHTSTQRILVELVWRYVPKPLPVPVVVHRLNLASVVYYLGRANGWRHWSWRKRGQFLRWKRFYTRIYADAYAGRCLVVYRSRYALDARRGV